MKRTIRIRPATLLRRTSGARRRGRHGWPAVAGALVLAIAATSITACRSSGNRADTPRAATPQEQARRDQLAAMGREDAEAAAESRADPSKRPKPIRNRRSGQHTIDQPR